MLDKISASHTAGGHPRQAAGGGRTKMGGGGVYLQAVYYLCTLKN